MRAAALVAVAGPVGAGKTTLVGPLAAELGFACAEEPLADNPFFDAFLRDPQEWAFESQLALMLGVAAAAAEARRSGTSTVVERTPREQLEVFCHVQHETGLIADTHRTLFVRLAQLAEAAGVTPDVLVVLHASADVLAERIAARGRPHEDLYPPDYMSRLYKRYGSWIASWTRCPIVLVDAVNEDVRDPAVVAAVAGRVRDALHTAARCR